MCTTVIHRDCQVILQEIDWWLEPISSKDIITTINDPVNPHQFIFSERTCNGCCFTGYSVAYILQFCVSTPTCRWEGDFSVPQISHSYPILHFHSRKKWQLPSGKYSAIYLFLSWNKIQLLLQYSHEIRSNFDL